MKEVATALRDAYLTLLNGIEVDGVPIPFYDEEFPANGDLAVFDDVISCYGLIKNQTETDATPFCQFQQDCSIQVHIVTKFPKAAGGKYYSELISGEVQEAIYPDPAGCVLNLGADFEGVSTRKEGSSNQTDNNLTNTVYTKILIFSHTIVQLT